MARIAGIDLPKNKRMEVALTYIYGIGKTTAQKILEEAGLDLNMKTDQLTEVDVAKIREAIDRSYKVEGDLRRDIGMNIKRLMDLGCLSRLASSARPAGPRPAHAYQCPNPQRPEKDADRQTQIAQREHLRLAGLGVAI